MWASEVRKFQRLLLLRYFYGHSLCFFFFPQVCRRRRQNPNLPFPALMAHSSSKQGTGQKKENTYLNAPKVLAIFWKISIRTTLTNQRIRSKKRQEHNPFHDPNLQSHKGLRLLGLGREVRELLDGFGFQTGGIQWLLLLLLLPTFFLLFRPDFLLGR